MYAIPPTLQQEEFSRAYVAAIASAAGYSVERRSVDVDHVDLSIHQRGTDVFVPLIAQLEVQLKCTYAHSPQNGTLSYPLDISAYNKLRKKHIHYRRILVVVHVPRDVTQWVAIDDGLIMLRHCAYWLSLCDLPEVNNETSCTVKIPTQQRFTVNSLKLMMATLANGGYL